MPKPYSYDLRQKVIQSIELDGIKKSEAAEVYQINRHTINLWLQRKASTGYYQALPNQPPLKVIRLLTGNNLRTLSWLMGIKRNQIWLNYGREKLANAQYQEP